MGPKSILIAVGVIILTIVFAISFIVSRVQTGTKNKKSDVKKTEIKKIIKTADITSDPLVYDGLIIETDSIITDWITERAFTLRAVPPSAFGGRGSELLVISRNPFPLPQKASEKEIVLGDTISVHIKGRVVILDRDQLENALGIDLDGELIKLDDNNIKDWELGTVLMLESVEKI